MSKLNNINSIFFDTSSFFNNGFERKFSSHLKELKSYGDRLNVVIGDIDSSERKNLLELFEESISNNNFENVFKSKSKIKRLLICLDSYLKDETEESLDKLKIVFTHILKDENWHDKYILSMHRNTFMCFGVNTKSYTVWKKVYLTKAKSVEQNQRYTKIARMGMFLEPNAFSNAINTAIKRNSISSLEYIWKSASLTASYLFSDHFALVLSEMVYINKTTGLMDLLFKLFEYENLPKNIVQIAISALVTMSKALNDYEKDRIRGLAIKHIDDPSIEKKWKADPKLCERDINLLYSAHQIMKIWVNEAFVEFFFEYAVDDRNRKQFWKKLTPYISELLINGNRATKNRLNQNENIRRLLKSDPRRFVETNEENVAVIMKIKDRYFIEYSQHGRANYCYLSTNDSFFNVYRRRFFNPGDFINGSMQMLFKRNYGDAYNLNTEGRVSHDWEGLWMHAYKTWFRRMLSINIEV